MRAAATAAVLSAAGSAAAAGPRLLHAPSVVPGGWVEAGESTAAEPVAVHVSIRRARAGELAGVLRRTSAPGGDFLRHLSWTEAGRLLRPPQARVDRVVAWLRAHGARGVTVHAHGDSATATLPAAGVEAMAHGRFRRYRHAASGKTVARITSGVVVSAEVADAVDTFTGFAGFPLTSVPRAAGGAPAAAGAVTPALLNKVHNIPRVAKSGKRNVQAVAQFQGQYVRDADLSAFCAQYEPGGAGCTIARYVGANSNKSAGVESMLDTEYIMGLGQGTETWVYSYPANDFCSDLLAWASDVTASASFPYTISLSYGSQRIDLCDRGVASRLSEDVQKMAAMGITVVVSSGDDGPGHVTQQGTNGNKISPSFPASIPFVVAVGSTYFVSGTEGEQAATTRFGSGGGFSYDFGAPDYQTDAIAAYLSNTSKPARQQFAPGGRGTPDVSLLGDQFTVIANGKEQAVGGTSASAPSFAAIVTLPNEACLAAGGRTLGFALPLLYANAAAFTDVTTGTSAVAGNDDVGAGGCAEGWDAATGLGFPDFPKLLAAVGAACRGAAPPVPPPPPAPVTPAPPPCAGSACDCAFDA
eukprot:gene3721-6211_t